MNVAILTVSDSCSANPAADRSGPALAALCAGQGWAVLHSEIVADERDLIAASIRRLAGNSNVVLTTGGTGIAARDVTPEATASILDKTLPGLGEIMRAEGLRHTRRAALSRGLAGTLGRALVVNLPGSPKGAVQSLSAILDLVPHIVALLNGDTAHAEESKRG